MTDSIFPTPTQDVNVTNASLAVTNAGTFAVQAAQSGTWTVQPGNTANTTAWKVDGSAVTQPVSAASLPLPSGASTSARQAAPGTAGTASADVTTIQGIASMTAVKVDGSAVTQPVSGTFWQATQAVSGAVSLSAGSASIGILGANSGVDIGDVTINNASGASAVNVQDGGNSLTVDGTFWQATQPISAASLPLPSGAATLAKQPALGTAGTASADVISVQGIASMTALKVDGSAVTQPVSGSVTVSGSVSSSGTATVTGNKAEDAAASDGDAGLPILGVRNDSATARTSTDGDYGMVALDSAGRVGVADLGGSISIDDNSGSITVDNGGTFATQATQSGTWTVQPGNTANTTAWKVDGSAVTQPVSGTFWQATQPVSGTVTANIGTSGSLALEAGNLATLAGAVHAEDAASADAHTGVAMMAVRKATAANTSGSDGDYEMLQISAGRLWASATIDAALPAGTNAIGKLAANDGVDVGDVTINNASGGSAVNIQDGGNSITVDGTVTANAGSGTFTVAGAVTNAGTFAVQDSQVVADNAAFTDGTTKVFMGGYIYDEVAGTALTENDAAAGRINVNRAQVHTLEDGVTRGRYATVTAGNALKIDGSAATQPVSGTVTANIGTSGSLALESGGNLATIAGAVRAEDVASADAHTGIPAMAVRKATPANTSGTDGDYEMLQVSAGRLWVSNAEEAIASIYNGQKAVTTSGTRVTLASSQAVNSVTIKAFTSNTSKIYVGNSSVSSSNGFVLNAGETVSLDVTNLNTVNLDAAVSGESVYYVAVGA